MNAKTLLSLVVLPIGLAATPAWAVPPRPQHKGEGEGRLYRIEDDQGRTFFSDRVSAEQNLYRQERLNPQGRPVASLEREKPKEQQIMEARLAALRQEAQKLITRQRLHDEALLSTFRSEDEIAAALRVKMEGFAKQRQLLETKLQNTIAQLDNHLGLAADYERNGQEVPAAVANNVAASQRSIAEIRAAIQANLERQKLTRNEYQADIDRYLFLTQSNQKTREQTLMPSVKEANSLGLFYCANDFQCNQAWNLARDFINQYSTTPPNVFNERLIMNRPPSLPTDISLSLSRIALTDSDYLLFLDILCHDSAAGRQLCASARVSEIRSRFRPYINDALARSGKQQRADALVGE